jgi:hypothetical protein
MLAGVSKPTAHRKMASEAYQELTQYREIYHRRVRIPTPEFVRVAQHKNRKTYAPIACEQVVGKFALKWFFGSQLLRPPSVLCRRRTVLSHVA